jgi:hypothetical protein
VQVRVILCDKAGKLLPPDQCRLLRAWVGAWFTTGRALALVEPAARQLTPGATAAAARKAEFMARLAPWIFPTVSDKAVTLCWDQVGEREVVLEGGLPQVSWIHRVAQGHVRVQTQHTTNIIHDGCLPVPSKKVSNTECGRVLG